MIKLFKDNTLPVFAFVVKDEDGNVVNLGDPDCTAAKCFIRKEGASANVFTGANCVAAFGTKANGEVNYTLPAGGITEVGSYSAQLELTFASGVQETERIRFQVEEGLRV